MCLACALANMRPRHGSIKKVTGLVLPMVDSASNSNARSYRPAAPSPCSHTRVMGGTAREHPLAGSHAGGRTHAAPRSR